MSWEALWLNYKKIEDGFDGSYLKKILVENPENRVVEQAAKELQRAIKEMLQSDADIFDEAVDGKEASGVILGIREGLGSEEFDICQIEDQLLVYGGGGSGVLYGVFEVIRQMRCAGTLNGFSCRKSPANPLRMLNHWDNADGSVERGYSGNSFFFKENKILTGDRIKDYARLAASVGINGVVINNVNVKGEATWFITNRHYEALAVISSIFTSYGIKLFLSLNFAAPMELSELNSADPLDPCVQSWWKSKCQEVFERIPGLGGFLVKADSEGRPGPFTYGRTHADGANMLAKAVEPYGALIIWRCFVYNCQQDWRDRKTDRARAGYDHFMPLDGEFLPNVILQIKNGPMDFQVREPVSPLFGGLTKTNQMLEVQIAQEYTGQQKHVCYLLPMWKEVLSFRTGCGSKYDKVSDIISGKTFEQQNCGIAAVSNTGDDPNWTGHDLAAANLYGFGRLSFETDLTGEDIAKEWISMTYGNQPLISETILKILMKSWPAYEKYTSPLGIGWMVNPNHHFGPNVDGYEYDRWGTYHRADHRGIGVDRSENGTGYAALYHEEHAKSYETVESCPEELLLFFHYVEYTYMLKTGKTLIQHIYDSHFEGAQEVELMAEAWDTLKDLIPEISWKRTEERLKFQVKHSQEWRDVVNSYFYRKSEISDEKGRIIY